MSDHNCPVVRIAKQPHPNADSLSVQTILGWEVCMKTEEWPDGTLASHLSEGVVIRPTTEAYVRGLGRVQLKIVSARYLEKSDE